MYSRVTRVQVPPEGVDGFIEAFRSSALPALRDVPGYAGSSLAVDRESGDGQVVAFWTDAEALKGSEDAVQRIRTDTTQATGARVVSVERYEIAMMERPVAPSAPAYLRVVRGRAPAERLDGMVQGARDQALPVLRGISGFRALTIGVDREGGAVMVTAVWASAEQRDAAEAQIAGIRRGIFDAAGATAPELALYEVIAVEFVQAGALSV